MLARRFIHDVTCGSVTDNPTTIVEQIEKASPPTRMAGDAAGLLDFHQNCVAITIQSKFLHVLDMP